MSVESANADADQSDLIERIRWNLGIVRERVEVASKTCGRIPSDIKIVAVTKTHPASLVSACIAAGLTDFGENYAQEAVAKIDELNAGVDVEWHFIGSLQTNKAAPIVARCNLIQSVDRPKLARVIGESAQKLGKMQDVLLQVHLGDEESKAGVKSVDLPSLLDQANTISGLRVVGLMGMAPLSESNGDKADPKRYFDRLAAIFDGLPDQNRQILSMGMSGDFVQAIETGSNMVRIGSALFGPRLAARFQS